MDVILHAGAHRTATTSFQTYLRDHRAALQAQGIAFWGPWRTRKGLLTGVADRPVSGQSAQRAAGRVAMNVANTRKHGVSTLIVSDENMSGSARRCLRTCALYPGIGERMARLDSAFGGVQGVSLQIRALDHWWASIVGFLVPRGEALPEARALETLVAAPRSWRQVITDLACACPGAAIRVTPFECFGDRPDLLLRQMTGCHVVPSAHPGHYWVNRRPDPDSLRTALWQRGEDPGQLSAQTPSGGWNPFNETQTAQLRETYADDLLWLRAGADGLATLTEDPEPARPRLNLAAAAMKRGRDNDGPARKLAH
jgi:hypothetical protein